MGSRRGHGEGSIYQRESDGRWVANVNLGYGPDGKRKRKVLYGKTRKEVTEKLKSVLYDQQVGKPIASNERGSVEAYLTSWLKVAKNEVRPATYVQYEVSVRCHLKPRLGHTQLTKLTPQHIREFVAAEVEAGLSPTTAKLARAVLRRALELAVEDGIIYRNPAKVIRQKGTASPTPKFKGKYLTEEQARAFLAAMRGHRLEVLYSVALALGLRRGEVLGLRWCDIDFDKGTMSVTGSLLRIGKATSLQRVATKTEESNRTIRVPTPLLTALRAQRVRQLEERLKAGTAWKGNEWDLVFTSDVGTGIEPRNLNRQLTSLLKKVGLPNIRFHDTRHTAAVLMLAQGIPLKVVSQVLGHSKIATTADIYAHVLPRQEQEAADMMGDLLWGNG